MRKLVVKSEKITHRDTRSITGYFHDLKDCIPLDPEVEYELAVKAKEGDEKAREQLIKANLKFVVSVAKQLERKGVKVEDLINEGNIGLIESVESFDPSRGFKFISYAVWKIRQKMQAYISNHQNTIRIPMSKTTLINKLKRRYNALEQELERTPSYDEIIQNFKDEFSIDEIDFFVSINNLQTSSLDAPMGDNEDNNALIDILTNNDSEDPSDILNKQNAIYKRNFLLNRLTTREAATLELLYGFNGYEPFTADEVAAEFGVTRQVIYQTHKRALKKLKYILINEGTWMLEN